MSGARYYKTGGVHVVEVPASALKIKLVDKGKRDCGIDMVNAGFFGVFGGEEYTLPVGHLVADYEATSANTRQSCEERGRFEGDRFCFDSGDWEYKNPLYGKDVTTLVIRDGEAGILDLEHAPLFDQCDYAVSGIPVMLDGKDVKWKDYVSQQGWDESSLRATLHSFVGLKADPETVYIIVWESATSNLIYSAEAFRVFSAMGFRDVIKLDGGGSTILRAGGVTVATSGNRRINSIITWADSAEESGSAGMKLALGAGHGKGASGKRCLKSLDPDETREWVLNDRIADQVEKLLKDYDGVSVLRLDDSDDGEEDVALARRVQTANTWGADFYLSIHHNAGINGGSGGGIVAYTHPQSSKASVEWRDELYEELIERTGLRGNRATPKATSNLYVLRETTMPAVLLELGFMDSKTDVPIILTEEYARKCAEAIVAVIVSRGGLTRKPTETNGGAPADWAAEAWRKATAAGVMDGTRPGDNLTRQELAVVLKKLNLV